MYNLYYLQPIGKHFKLFEVKQLYIINIMTCKAVTACRIQFNIILILNIIVLKL